MPLLFAWLFITRRPPANIGWHFGILTRYLVMGKVSIVDSFQPLASAPPYQVIGNSGALNKSEVQMSDEAKRCALEAVVECNSLLPDPGNFRRWTAAILTATNHFTAAIFRARASQAWPLREAILPCPGSGVKEDNLIMKFHRIILWSLLLSLGTFISVSPAQQPPPATPGSIEVVQVIGLPCVKQNTKGNLKVENGSLTFASPKNICEVPAASIQDVVTGADSQRVIGGTVGTVSRLAPYGGGTALSLLRSKVDIITIEYRDPNGGLHGAIFTMPVGKAESVKEALLAQGAHTSIPSQAQSTSDSPLQSEAMEQTN